MKLQKIIGPTVFWLSYPLAYVYLRIGSRSRVLIVVDDSALLLKGRFGLGMWALPGGGIHRGEEPIVGAQREVAEETGIKLTREDLHFMYTGRANTKGLQFNYVCYYAKLDKRPPIRKRVSEIAVAEWVPLKDVNPTNATRNTNQAVQAWLQR